LKSVNKEQLLFILALAVLGTLAYFRLEDRVKHRAVPAARKAFELREPAPAAELQFIDASSDLYSRQGRNIFAPPLDWLPLESLILDFPPLLELEVVGPYTEPALGASFFKTYHLSLRIAN